LESSHSGEEKEKNNLQEEVESIGPRKEGKVMHQWAIWDEQP
jgi:hypothetical protein